jgi:hypothetical protein
MTKTELNRVLAWRLKVLREASAALDARGSPSRLDGRCALCTGRSVARPELP